MTDYVDRDARQQLREEGEEGAQDLCTSSGASFERQAPEKENGGRVPRARKELPPRVPQRGRVDAPPPPSPAPTRIPPAAFRAAHCAPPWPVEPFRGQTVLAVSPELSWLPLQVTGPSELMGTILPGYLRHTDRTRRPCLALPFRMTLPGSRHRHPNPCVPWSISSSHKDTENCCERRSEAEAVGLRARRPGPGPGVPRLCCSLPFAGLPRGVRREEKLEHFL